ncbi:phenylacetate--CoA ligase family protein [Rhodoferax sp.]|uniref:phenylacetate--CoA ligase family protein n=1 Tax=Rhodoferax sp. TaxID=50421 RepID=UPI002777086F|nr:AMP-binding protein [Rhodoferax sp.]
MSAMESWSWPPRYDNSYRPPPHSRYWFTVRETMPADERDQAIVQRLREVCDYAYNHCAFYRDKWDQAAFHPSQVRSLEDFERRCPVVTKADLRQAQHRAPPFGDYLCIADDDIHHIHGTSGTTGRPTAFAIGRDDWQAIANAHARVMWGMGIRPGDIVFVAAIFSLYMGSWGALCGAERLGAKAFPFGAGAPGMSSRAVQWLGMMKPQAFYGTPSYALYLAETAAKEGFNAADFGLERMFFSGEPGASVAGVRERIIDAYQAQVFDCGSMAEMSPFMNVAASAESSTGMLCWQDICYTEVCDPKTFERVPYGQRGTPVYTHLERTSQPMIRLVSGDLALWSNEPTACGRTYPSLPQGIFGRIDDMITIRGENVYPSEIDAALSRLPDYGGEHRIVVSRAGHMDELLLQVETNAALSAQGPAAMEAFRLQVAASVQTLLGLRTMVEVLPPGTYPRTDFKARRVIDDRDVFKQMTQRLHSAGA